MILFRLTQLESERVRYLTRGVGGGFWETILERDPFSVIEKYNCFNLNNPLT